MPHVFSRPLLYKKRTGITEEIIHGVYYFLENGSEPMGDDFPVVSAELFYLLHFLALEIDLTDPLLIAALETVNSGGEKLLSAVSDLASALGVCESELVCKRYRMPGDKHAGQSSRFLNPHSLIHVALLGACKQQGFSTSDYWSEGHPVQERIYSVVGKATRVPTSWCQDSSGLSTAITSAGTLVRVWTELLNSSTPIARDFLQLAATAPKAAAFGRSFEKELMTAFSGKLLAMSNTNGTFLVKSTLGKDFGLVVKFASRSDVGDIGHAMLGILSQYSGDHELVLELKTYLKARMSGHKNLGLEVSYP